MKKRIIVVIALCFLIILIYLSSYPFGCQQKEEIIIIGIDGGSWNIISPLIKEGKLPNLNKLMKEGVYGELNSGDHLDAPTIWTYIATGGAGLESENTVWRILSEHGRIVGVSDWPYVSEINGFMIPAYYDEEKGSYPPYMYDFGAKILLKNPIIEFLRKSYYMKILIPVDRLDKDILYDFYLLDYNSREFFYLRDKFKPDVSAIVFYGPDRLQQYLWMYTAPEKFQNVDEEKIKKYGNVIEEYYKEFDKFVGRVVNCNKDATIFIVSGYGFDSNAPPKIVDEILVNNILESAGFLKFDYRGEIDFFNTKAYSLNDEMEDVAYVKIKADRNTKPQLKEVFSNIHAEGTNQNIFTVTETDEGIILRRNVPLQLGDMNIVITNDVYPIKDFSYRRIISGRRIKEGVLIVYGKNISKGKVIYGATIYDIAPTILYLFNVSSRGMGGDELSNIFI